MKLNQIVCIFIISTIFVQTVLSLDCYSCDSGSNPDCGGQLKNPSPSLVKTCAKPDATCVVFNNTLDKKTWRGCSDSLYVPPDVKPGLNGCVADRFLNNLVCSCTTDLCNGDNSGLVQLSLCKRPYVYVPDPVDCSVYYNCTVQNSLLFSEKYKCPGIKTNKGTTIQKLFAPMSSSCIFPSVFPKDAYPTADFPAPTCTIPK